MKFRIILSTVLIVLLVGIIGSAKLFAHCQVPCGIYDDAMRIKMMAEHITTIEKAMNQINLLSKEARPNYNQVVRWVTNKEKHAEKFCDIVTYYFLTQRIKTVAERGTDDHKNYLNKLEVSHHLLVYAMKAKQSTDLEWVGKLKKLLKKFESLYFAK